MTCKYEHAVPQGWEEGLALLKVDLDGDDPVAVSGPCPRCHDHLERDLREGDPFFPLAAGQRLRFLLHCNCDAPHQDRPAGARGCGAYGGMSIWR